MKEKVYILNEGPFYLRQQTYLHFVYLRNFILLLSALVQTDPVFYVHQTDPVIYAHQVCILYL